MFTFYLDLNQLTLTSFFTKYRLTFCIINWNPFWIPINKITIIKGIIFISRFLDLANSINLWVIDFVIAKFVTVLLVITIKKGSWHLSKLLIKDITVHHILFLFSCSVNFLLINIRDVKIVFLDRLLFLVILAKC